jgi:hypothetical protein
LFSVFYCGGKSRGKSVKNRLTIQEFYGAGLRITTKPLLLGIYRGLAGHFTHYDPLTFLTRSGTCGEVPGKMDKINCIIELLTATA